jgi:hypothetical protein
MCVLDIFSVLFSLWHCVQRKLDSQEPTSSPQPNFPLSRLQIRVFNPFKTPRLAMTEISEWVFEGVLQFLRSPLWTAPVHGFIETHCHEFVAGEDENKLIYTQLHNEFRTLVDDLLSSFLEELGVSGEAFIDAIKAGENEELSAMVAEFLFALDDFASFRTLMEKKNLELELEAMYEYARYSGQPQPDEDDDMTDEERFLLEMAVQMSLGETDITLKRLEKEDAELLQALALSVAVEQERLVRKQIQEGDEGNVSGEALPAGHASPARRTAQEISEEVRQQRAANVERVLFELAAQQQQAVTANQPAVVHSSLAPIAPSADAQRIVQQSLAPVGERRIGATFGAKGSALPGIAHHAPLGAISSAPVAQQLPLQPTFQQLKDQATAKVQASVGAGGTTEPTQEELDQRAAYFKAQRERLLLQKSAAREKELDQYKKEQASQGAPMQQQQPEPVQLPTEADATREMRLALARRFREDLIQETRRAA